MMFLKVRMLRDSRIHDRPNDLFTECRESITRRVSFNGADRFCDKRLDLKVGPNSMDGLARAHSCRCFGVRLGVQFDQLPDHIAFECAKKILVAELTFTLVNARHVRVFAQITRSPLEKFQHAILRSLAASAKIEI